MQHVSSREKKDFLIFLEIFWVIKISEADEEEVKRKKKLLEKRELRERRCMEKKK